MSLTPTSHTTCYQGDLGSTLIGFSTLHQCFKYVEDDATVRTVFAEKQPFKGVKNYFTDALLYQEVSETSKESLPDNDDSGNEADSESEADLPAILVGEPIITCFNKF